MTAKIVRSPSRQTKRAKPLAWLPPANDGQDGAIHRADLLRDYWKAFGKAKLPRDREWAWINAITVEPNIPKVLPRLCMRIIAHMKAGVATVSHAALAGDLDLDIKSISNGSKALSEAGYLIYIPGQKGESYSQYRMKVPEAHAQEDRIRWKKTSTFDKKNQLVSTPPRDGDGGNFLPGSGKKFSTTSILSRNEGASAPFIPDTDLHSRVRAHDAPAVDHRIENGSIERQRRKTASSEEAVGCINCLTSIGGDPAPAGPATDGPSSMVNPFENAELHELAVSALGDIERHIAALKNAMRLGHRLSRTEAEKVLRSIPDGFSIDAAMTALLAEPESRQAHLSDVERLDNAVSDLIDRYHGSEWDAVLVDLGHIETDEAPIDELDTVDF